MPLPTTYNTGVAFIGHQFDANGPLTIVGTGFLVTLPATVEPGAYTYIVTAGHVVNHAYRAFVRGPATDGIFELEVFDWFTHPNYDVAVALVKLPPNSTLTSTSTHQFIDDPHWSHDYEWNAPFEIELGDVVYFIGLLGKVAEMTDRCIPVARSGTVAQVWQERLPKQRSSDHDVEYLTANLIDCRSFGGFSGAPCYVQQGRGAFFRESSTIGTRYRTAFLGLVGGHFDDWAPVRSRIESLNVATSRVNTGIGYVVPAEHIRATLQFEDVVEDRERRGAQFRTWTD